MGADAVLPLLSDRSARRVYQTLAWLWDRRTNLELHPLRPLRFQAIRMGLRAETAREVEELARAAKSIKLGRDPEEKLWLDAALEVLTREDPRLKKMADELLRRFARKSGNTPEPGRVSPSRFSFEESEAGPALVAPSDVGFPWAVQDPVAPSRRAG